MDFVQSASALIVERVRAMGPAARMVAIGALMLIVLGAAWLYTRRPPEAYLMGGQSFSAAQLGNMEAAFGKAGLADYRIQGDRLRVPLGQQAKYMAALADAGAMPRDSGEYLRSAVNTGSFMISGSRQQAQIDVARQSELQLAVRRMPGVNDAAVLIGEETRRGFPPEKIVTASVSIEPAGPSAVSESTIEAIRSFVANAWGAGLKPADVTVVLQSPQQAGAGGEPSRAPPKKTSGNPAWQWWTTNGLTLAMGALALSGLLAAVFALWPSARRSVADAPPETEPQPTAVVADEQPPRVHAGESAVAPPHYYGLRRELTLMVRQDPQSAAGVLRTWIGNSN